MEIINSVVTWALVIVGWFIIHREMEYRECRRELRKTIDELTGDIYGLEHKAWDYYLQDGGSDESARLAVSMKRDKTSLSHRINLLTDTYKKGQHFQNVGKMVAYGNAITEHPFEAKDRAKLPTNDSRLLDISHAANDLVHVLEAEFLEIYKK
jgi:hypothetical protein